MACLALVTCYQEDKLCVVLQVVVFQVLFADNLEDFQADI